MIHASLFSGGCDGFGLAAAWMGWKNLFHVEIDPFCRKLLQKNFEGKLYADINKFCGKKYAGLVDVLSGGDPCQPHSIAGLGKGKDDNRFLWPQMFRIIREIQPVAVVNENVNGSISNGILDFKIDDLESIGYSCQAYSIPAEAVGALHQRERVWIIAVHPDRTAVRRTSGYFGSKTSKEESKGRTMGKFGKSVDLRIADPDPDLERFEERYFAQKPGIRPERLSRYFGFGTPTYGNISRDVLESGIIRSLDGLSEGMDYVDRGKRLKALGNAVVPQVAFEIFQALNQYLCLK